MTTPRLSELLAPFRWSRASDPRDKIYGLSGLIPAHDRELIGVNSEDMYTISIAECYARVASCAPSAKSGPQLVSSLHGAQLCDKAGRSPILNSGLVI